jgi:putative pyruvate formate lyase activating enzyme
MLRLQERGAANINLVTPGHVLPQILAALCLARDDGLTLPLVYNTSGYERTGVIRKLRGIVDTYLCDLRYFYPETAGQYSSAQDYPQVGRRALREMYRQVGPERLIVRCLLLPGHREEAEAILSWVVANLPGAGISIMAQYQPYHEAVRFPAINRRVTREEYSRLCSYAESLGIERGWMQEYDTAEDLAGVHFTPSLEI